jgi:succinate dehydrogenase / fumarate reductase cytochrome b subunit
MALSGIVLCGFVLVHMAGNLLLYAGADALNAYAATLKSNAVVLWGARSFLLLNLAVHAWAAFSLIGVNRRARPTGYRAQEYTASTYASRTMRWGGPILLLFIAFHLVHFTIAPAFGTDVYRNVVTAFRNPLIAGLYGAAMIALAGHLFHGVVSLLQTLGLSHPQYDGARVALGSAFALAVTAGNLSFPIAVFFGLVP